MHPFLRNVVIGVVGLLIAVVIGVFLFIQGWIWSQRAYRTRSTGMSVAIALGGGFMILLAALALAGAAILVILFYL